jgi:hypothetical protein
MGFIAGPPPVPEPKRYIHDEIAREADGRDKRIFARQYMLDRYAGISPADINYKGEFEDLLWEHQRLLDILRNYKTDTISRQFCIDFLNGNVTADEFVEKVMK